MSYLNRHQFDLGAESQSDAQVSVEVLEKKAAQIRQQIAMLPTSDKQQTIVLQHELAQLLCELDQSESAWQLAFPALQYYLDKQNWQRATEVCDTLFRLNHQDSLPALGHGLWLSITFPVDLELTVAQLKHVIDDTPEKSDGAAVAAAVAAYVDALRGDGDQSSETTLVIGQLLNDVARRHSNIQDQAAFDQWFKKLELDQPERILGRMRNIIDVLVQDNWWFDRDALQQLIPQEDQ